MWSSDLTAGSGRCPQETFEALVRAHFPGGPTFGARTGVTLQKALHGETWQGGKGEKEGTAG